MAAAARPLAFSRGRLILHHPPQRPLMLTRLRNKVGKQTDDLASPAKLRFTFLHYEFPATDENAKLQALKIALLCRPLDFAQKSPGCLGSCLTLTGQFI